MLTNEHIRARQSTGLYRFEAKQHLLCSSVSARAALLQPVRHVNCVKESEFKVFRLLTSIRHYDESRL